MSEQAPSARLVVGGQIALKITVLALVVATTGLPINDLLDYAILVVATVIVAVGAVKTLPSRWLAAALLAAAVVAGHVLLHAPRIEEGHNFFLPGSDAAKTSGLPQAVYDALDRQFAAQYPPEKNCNDQSRGCWRPSRNAAQDSFAYSADAIFDRGPWSRRVTGIDFSDPVHARLGFVNEWFHGWSSNASDVERFSRDRRSINVFDRYHLTFPLYIMYRFPAAFIGSDLCWRGDVLWEGEAERFEVQNHADMTCRTLQPADAGRRVYAVAINLAHPLAVTLKPNWTVRLRGWFASGLTLGGVLGILGLMVRVAPRRLVWPAVVIGLSLVTVSLNDITFIGGYRPLDGGDDGLTYEGYARDIIRALLTGDLMSAWRGAESLYYFTPGFRYVSALWHVVFGETFLGYLSLVLALPFLVHALFRRFLPETWARVIVLGFVATPVGALMGSSYFQYVKWAARGFADSCGQTLLLAAMVVLIPRAEEVDDPPVMPALWGALLMSIASFVRPNVVLAAGVMVVGATLFALRQRKLARAGVIVAGFATLIVSPLHNWVFARSTVLFSDNVTQPQTLVMPPSRFFEAAYDILHLDLASDRVIAVIKKLAWWLSGPGNFYVMIPVNGAAVVTLAWVCFFGSRFDPWLRLIALATLLEHGTGVTYANWDRYHLVTWLLTALVAIVWLHQSGIGNRLSGIRKRFGSPIRIRES
jgi:hypothetical protein